MYSSVPPVLYLRLRKCRPKQLNAEPELEFQFVNWVYNLPAVSSPACINSSWALNMKVVSVFLTMHNKTIICQRYALLHINDTALRNE